MPEVDLKDTPRRVQDLFNKGFGALERGNLEYAIDMLSECLMIEPLFLQARKFLRAAEIRRLGKKATSPFAHAVSTIAGAPLYAKVLGLQKSGKLNHALVLAEKLLRRDPLNPKFIMLFARVAADGDYTEAGVQTIEIAQEYYPDNQTMLNLLGSLYLKLGRTRLARACFEKLIALRPRDPAVLKALKDAMALDSMAKDGWSSTAEEGGSYRDMMKDEKEAGLLEKEGKAVRSEKDADTLIAETVAKVEAEPGNINYYRALVRLYSQRQRFDDAIETLQKAIVINPGDPELDRAMSQARIGKFDQDVAALKEAGDEAGALALGAERDQFMFDNMQERVARYPNDLRLRYEWGYLLYQHDYVNESIQQFQLAQRSPKDRVRALFYLGLCFKHKEQYDLALEQLEKASSEVTGMDDTKKDVLYELGLILEIVGQKDKAAEYYKQIYQSDISYKDIAEKIEQAYRK